MGTHIYNVWDKIYRKQDELPKDIFIVVGGNEESGMSYEKQELISKWKSILKQGYRQDISIYYNGKLIRSIRNFNSTILGKVVQWEGISHKFVKTEYIKYK